MVYWELAACKRPYSGYENDVIRAFVLHGDRLEIPMSTPPTFRMVIEQCWLKNPNDRPNSSELIEMIEECIEVEDGYKHGAKKFTSDTSSNGTRDYPHEGSDIRLQSESHSSSSQSDYVSSTACRKQELTHPPYESGEEKPAVHSTAAYSFSSKNKSDTRDLTSCSNLKFYSLVDAEPGERITKLSNVNVSSKESSKPSSFRSSSPSDDKKGSHLSSYEDSHHQTTGTAAKQTKSSKSPPSSRKSHQDEPITVYVPDLPTNIDSNSLLEKMIRQCLELKHKQKVLNIKCDTQLGIGIIYLRDDEDKNNLINTIEKIIIEPSQNATISFVDELELISYIVIDEKDIKELPSAHAVCRQWVDLYKVQSQPRCELLSVQFPNIFRIVTHSLSELLTALSVREFSIKNRSATVYFRATCSFFEDLPRTTNLDRLKEAIGSQISSKYMSKKSVYIQYNKEGANAVVLTSGRARIWALHSSILLDGQVFMKKDSLSCRLLVRSVPKDISTSLIQNHEMFAKAVVKALPSNEHVIIELSDRDVYEKCIVKGALRIDDHVLGIEAYTYSSNPEDSEIDGKNWYDTEMCNYKPDIMPFISNPQHPIFRFKWNSKAFLEQYRRWISNGCNIDGKDSDKYETSCNHKCRLLQMTVMLNTIGVVKRGFYHIGKKEIKLKPDRLKTILYDHKSKLQRGKTTSLSHAIEFPYASTSVKVVNEDCLIVYKSLLNQGCRPVVLNMVNANSLGGYKRGDGAQEETLFRRSNYFQSLDLELDDGKPTARFYCNSNCELEPLAKGDVLYPMDEFGAIYTSGLTVFRQPEDTGYAFMETPMCDVCAIAMAAYRDPKIENDLLTSKYSIGTRKKIENIFAIAHHQKHDSLVLSALGCDAFRSPPRHVAAIFKSVIEQYAEYFKYIYFAIVDDHSTDQYLNSFGNFLSFQQLLDHLEEKPKRHKLVDMMIGPWRILNQKTIKEVTLSDIRICYLEPCLYGGHCNDLQNEQHSREYSHPPLCPYADNTTPCKQKNDSQHTLWFSHRYKCLYGGECELVENDLVHTNQFEHPEFCCDGGRCENMDNEHLKVYRHVPLCKYRRQCVEYNRGSNDHCLSFRHCIPMSRCDHSSLGLHDEKPISEERHSFQPPCSFTPFNRRQYDNLCEAKNIKKLSNNVQNHQKKYSHDEQVQMSRDNIHESSPKSLWKLHSEYQKLEYDSESRSDQRTMCRHGSKCRDQNDPHHYSKYSHPRQHKSESLASCSDERIPCRHGRDCHDKDNHKHYKMSKTTSLIGKESLKNLDASHEAYADNDGVFHCILNKNDSDNQLMTHRMHTLVLNEAPQYCLLLYKPDGQSIIETSDSNIDLVKSKFYSLFNELTGNYCSLRKKFVKTSDHYVYTIPTDLNSSSSSEEQQVNINQINNIPKFICSERAFFNMKPNALDRTYKYVHDGITWRIPLPDISSEIIMYSILSLRSLIVRIGILYLHQSTTSMLFGSGLLVNNQIVLTCVHNFHPINWSDKMIAFTKIYVSSSDPASPALLSRINPNSSVIETQIIQRGLKQDNILTGYNGELYDKNDLNAYKYTKGFELLTIDNKSISIGYLIEELSSNNNYEMHNCSTLTGSSGAVIVDSIGRFIGIHIEIANSRISKKNEFFDTQDTFNKFIHVHSTSFKTFIHEAIIPNINNDQLEQKWEFV
ncbi:unnamed protein product [Rotaria sp. Silwood1]|nr:unnamed protein product [Rotaria sp. Silwood1]CAF1514972.1 unnamed protein product [Rotaria sp. Silwood1]